MITIYYFILVNPQNVGVKQVVYRTDSLLQGDHTQIRINLPHLPIDIPE